MSYRKSLLSSHHRQIPMVVFSNVALLPPIRCQLVVARCSSARPCSSSARPSNSAVIAAAIPYPRSQPTARAIAVASIRTTPSILFYTVRVKVERVSRSPPLTRPPIGGNRGIIIIIVPPEFGHANAVASSVRRSAASRRRRPRLVWK